MNSLTPEQSAVVSADVPPGTALKVIAYAGAGKTSTLVEVARKYPSDECLYLAFNKSVELEAIERFPCNTTAKTGHALAWKHVGYRYPHLSNLYNWQLAKAYGLSLYEASLLSRSFESFLSSADNTPLRAHVEPDKLGRFIPGLYECEKVEQMEQLFLDMKDGRNSISMTHSGYLKLFQIGVSTGDFVLGFPVVLLDEAQDTNPVMLRIVLDQMKQGSRCYFVGDPYQQIYSWRGALDAMTKIEAPEFRITQSFRFGNAVADLSSLLLKTFFYEEHPLRGFEKVSSAIVNVAGKHTVVCRSNAGLIREAYQAAKKNAKVHVLGEQAFQQTLEQLRNIHCLYVGKKQEITEKRISFHSNYAALKTYAEESLDIELSSKINVIDEYGSGWPDVATTITNTLMPSASADIILTTCHKAKGLEWSSVKLATDFSELFYAAEGENGVKKKLKQVSREKDGDEWVHPEEINLLYVAATRAKNCLQPTFDLHNLKEFCEKEATLV